MRTKAKIPPHYRERAPGDKMPDGTIYLGRHKGKDWFAAAEDARDEAGNRLRLNFNRAAEYARNSRAHGHDDWMLPPGREDRKEPDILHKMFNHRHCGAFNGTYSESETDSTSFYWSSTARASDIRAPISSQRFVPSGFHAWFTSATKLSIRCVRAVPVAKKRQEKMRPFKGPHFL